MDSLQSLRNYLNSLASVPPLQWVKLATMLRLRKLKKGELYFREHESFQEVGFVAKGLLYNFHIAAGGDEIVSDFRKEGDLVACYSDLLRGTPASYSSKALEPTILVTTKYENLQKLYNSHPCWDRIGRISAEQLFVQKEQREHNFMTLDATGRYEAFMKGNRTLSERVPQYLIASFLGVSPVSLSRIRGERQ